MKKKTVLRIVSMAIGLTMAVGLGCGVLAGCGSGNKALVLSSEQPDGVFNPFFYTSGADGEIVGQTMIGMLSSDKNGAMVAGENEPCVSYDFSVVTTGSKAEQASPDDYTNYYTDYYFALKDDIKFSDGSSLTIKDVLFNIYMYLDPAYTGSATMYSVDIQGLAAYRTQQPDADAADQEDFDRLLNTDAQERIDAIRDWAAEDDTTYDDLDETSQSDLNKIDGFFRDELNTDWNNAMAADLKEYEKYVDKDGNKIFTENWQVFLYNYGVITLTRETNADKTQVWYTAQHNYDTKIAKTQTALTGYVFDFMLGGKLTASKTYKTNVVSVITQYATANTFRQYLVSEALKAELGGEMTVRTVSGITAEHGNTIPGEGGTPKQLDKERDILHIRINGEDPKAIQNFAFTVAPLNYYSSHASEFSTESGQEYYGVEFGDTEFMDSVRYIQVPMGAGPYRASTLKGTKPEDINDLKNKKNSFYSDNIAYLESNENFLLGAPKIKKLRFKVVNTSQLYENVKNGDISYASPSATEAIMNDLRGADKKKLDYTLTDNLGYGYIGINASFVQDLNIRKAIMHAINTQLCIDYYGSTSLATAIFRPMSTVLKDYYPTTAQSYYKYDGTGETSRQLAIKAGYTVNGDALYKNGKPLKFTFTIAGDSADHPAFNALTNAAEVLNKVGFDITVTRDSTALSKLSAGRLEVWAAAWSSSSDPDMFQVYHKDSSATSILAWGFPWIESTIDPANSTLGTQQDLLEALAAKIEEGRETTVVADRRKAYSESTGNKLDDGGNINDLCALDLVMELAVELPTYQRKALFVYKKGLFSEESINKYFGENATAFASPLNRIWEIEFAN